jgi:hypothetical protein
MAPPPPPLSIDTLCGAAASGEAEEPLSPTARMFHDFYIVAVLGLGKPIDLEPARAGVGATLSRHPPLLQHPSIYVFVPLFFLHTIYKLVLL